MGIFRYSPAIKSAWMSSVRLTMSRRYFVPGPEKHFHALKPVLVDG